MERVRFGMGRVSLSVCVLGWGWGVCSLVATVPGNKGAAYFPQIVDLPELPGDTFREP